MIMLYAVTNCTEREPGQKLYCLLAKMRCGVFAGDFIAQIMITFADFIRYVIVNRIADFFKQLLQLANCNDLPSVTFPHLCSLAN